MNKIFKALSFTLLLMICMVLFCFGASAYNENGILFSIEGDGITITGVDDTVTGDVVIPSEIGGYPIKAIGDGAFQYVDEITSLVIPEGVVTIGEHCFDGCTYLEKIYLPSTLKHVGDCAFWQCEKLTELKLPENLETIGEYAFGRCYALPDIVIPAKVTSIGPSAFAVCSSAETVTFEGTALRTIGDFAFGQCSALASITIPEGVTHIGATLFYQCEKLAEIILPESITSIKSGLVQGTLYDKDYSYDADMLYIGKHLITAGNYDVPAKYTVRKGTKSIAQYAFSDKYSLETLVIYKGLASIEDDAFFRCDSLGKICFTGSETEWNQIAKGNNDFSAYTIEFNYYICPHENTENRDAVAPDCNNAGYTAGVYCKDCEEWIGGHKMLNPAHKDSDGDALCDVCSIVASDIIIGESKRIVNGDFDTELRFVAPANGEYTLTSALIGYANPYVTLYDADWKYLASNYDISDEDSNFKLVYTLVKGNTYYWHVGSFGRGEAFDVLLTLNCEHTGGKATCKDKAECAGCGIKYGALNPENHTGLTAVEAEAPTCGKEGKTAGEKCIDCGKVTVQPMAVPATGEHKYTNACDTDCNMCREIRAVTHTYSNACDAECNICKATRTPSAHKGGTATCKVKAVCSVCGTSYGSLKAHTYSNVCDADCNVCSAKRTPSVHKYSNSCDTTCNICDEKRSIKHSYTTVTTKATLKKNGKQITKCKVCGYVSKTTTVYYPKTIKLSATSYTYTGKAKKPTVTVKDSKGKTLKNGTDYTVKYSKGRKSVGKYTVTVTFKGKYSGTKKLTFEIVPAKATLSKLTAGSKQLTATWKTVSGATGYEVVYSTSKKFTKKTTKTVTIKKSKTKKTTVKKLKKGKKYYVKVRAYKTVSGKKIYGAYSSVKSVKVK